jgi:hypothetical protein
LVQKKLRSGEGILVCHVSEKRLGGGGGEEKNKRYKNKIKKKDNVRKT